jgi:ABC-2 type transport system ATP-binding protein
MPAPSNHRAGVERPLTDATVSRPLSQPVLSARNLTKRYGEVVAVDALTFALEPGSITGFLGPNGAGKSTTLRMIVGLARPDHGTSTISGRPFVELPNPTRVVGTLLDASAMHGGRTGRATLKIAAQMAGMSTARVDHLLNLVGLTDAADRRVGGYSLGMRQRLGIAQTLVGEPEVLILDEPANGLDPEGIAWMRGLLRDFADRGGTVLLSSHLLHEVQATVDHLVVIAAGAVAAAGRMEDLLASGGLVVRSPEPSALLRLLTSADVSFSTNPDGSLTVDPSSAGLDAERIGRLALEHSVPLSELRGADSTALEDLFFSLTANSTVREIA